MRLKYFAVYSFYILAAFLLASCRGGESGHPMTEDEEEAVFMSVYEPGAEGRYDDAIHIADSLLSNVAMSDTLRAYIMIERGTAIFNRGDMDHALSYADTMVRFGQRVGIDQLSIQGEMQKGVCYRREERYDSAIACYDRSLRMALRDHDVENEQVLSDLMSVMHTELGRYPEAIKLGHRALQLAEALEDDNATVQAAASLGSALQRSGDPSAAIRLLRPYAPRVEEMPPLVMVKFYTPLVRSLIETDSLAEARRWLDIMKGATAGIPRGHQAYTAPLEAETLLLAREGRHQERWKIYCEIDSSGTPGKAADVVAAERAGCLADMGEWRGAYDRMKTAYDTLRVASRVETDRQLSELNLKYDTLSQKYEIERLERRNMGYAAAALACLAVALLSVAIVGHTRRRARGKQQREYIRGLEQERARMARELHDGIAGDLMGMRLMMGSRSQEENAEALRDVATRVRDLSHSLMPPEFGMLTLRTLFDAMLSKQKERLPAIDFRLEVSGSYPWDDLPAETRYELYRMVQECVANAMRHASPRFVEVCMKGDTKFEVTVRNDGCNPRTGDDRQPGIGTRVLMTRAEIIGAYLTVDDDGETYVVTITEK